MIADPEPDPGGLKRAKRKEKRSQKKKNHKSQGCGICGSGLIQYRSASSILAQSEFGSGSGSTKSFCPYPMQIRIYNSTFED
jgi:hypothetical protein